MKGAESCVEVARSGRDLVLANGVVELRLVFRDGGYCQEFYGVDRSGRRRLLLSTIHRNLIPFTEHRVSVDPMLSGHRQHLFEVNRESLRMAYSEAKVAERGDHLSVRLSGRAGDFNLASTIVLCPGSKFVRVRVEAEPAASSRGPVLEYLMAAYAFLPDGMLLDSYKRPDYAWAPSLRPGDDHVIGERSFTTAAVVVQRRGMLAALVPDPSVPRSLPVALDLDLRNGLLSAPLLAYGFCASEPEGHFSRHDRTMVLRPGPEKMSYGFWLYLDAEARSSAGFEPVQQFAWRLAQENVAERVGCAEVKSADDLPSAYVLLSEAASRDSLRRAERIIRHTLSRQRPEGVFEPPDETAGPGRYATSDISEGCRWLLAIHRDLEADLDLLLACRGYGDFLAANQCTSGAIPAFFSDDIEPLPELRESAETAASGRFLAELYEVTGERAYLAASRRAARFVSSLNAKRRYHDRAGLLAGVLDLHDPHTWIAPQGSAAARHSADLFVALYRLSREERYLKLGLAALAQMCWFQHTRGAEPGGFAAGNAFGGSAPHACCGRTLLEYYEVTRRPDLMERGLAAVRTGLAAGAVEAAAVRSWAVRKFGSALIDVRSRTAYAIGSCWVDALTVGPGAIAFEVRNGFAGAAERPVTIRFVGMRGESYRVNINGQGKRYSKGELETGIRLTV